MEYNQATSYAADYYDESTGIEYYLEHETGYYYYWDSQSGQYRYYEGEEYYAEQYDSQTSAEVDNSTLYHQQSSVSENVSTATSTATNSTPQNKTLETLREDQVLQDSRGRNASFAGASSRDVSLKNRERSASTARRKTSRIDPRQIPRPVTYASQSEMQKQKQTSKKSSTATNEDGDTSAATSALGETFYSCSGTIPPSPGVDFAVVDEGNASPKFMRSTLWEIPSTNELVKGSHLSIGMIVQPLADTGNDEPVPTALCSDQGPIRCDRCGAYMNAFNRFTGHGERYNCSICGMSNEVPSYYTCHLDSNGFRRDRDERVELHKGSVDYFAPSYEDFPARPPCFLFVLDVSYGAQISGMFQTACEGIREVLLVLAENPRNRAGIITYDQSVHFYSLSQKKEISVSVLADVDELFLPLPSEEVLVQEPSMLETLLDALPSLHPLTQDTPKPTCFGAAAGVAALILAEYGGKVIITQSTLPDMGCGKLEDREDPALANTSAETALFHPQDSYYQFLSTRFAESFITVDLFAGASSAYLDLASTGTLSSDTGGQLHYYAGFDQAKDGSSLRNDLFRAVARETGFQATMTLRTSSGLEVAEQYGSFFRKDSGELHLPTVDCDKSFAFRIEHQSDLPSDSKACFQAALLYTDALGQRRIRVHTVALSITSSMSQLFRHADIDALVNLSMRQAVRLVCSTALSVADTRTTLRNSCVDVLHVYRKRCAVTTSSGQLILPEALKLLPLYTLGMLKNPLLADSIPADLRVHLFHYVTRMPLPVSVPFAYPRLYALHRLPEDSCIPRTDGSILVPPLELVSSQFLESHGVYLLDNGLMFGMLFGADSDPLYVQELFGLPSLQGVDLYQLQVFPEPTQPHSLGSKVHTLMEKLHASRPLYCSLRVFSSRREGGEEDSLDMDQFTSKLVEDEYIAGVDGKDQVDRMSYVEFLCWVHRQIQDKFV